MEGNRLFTGIYALCKWFCYFFYLNIMWIACVLLGGIVLGFTPSTISLFTVARKTAMGEKEVPVFRTFWRTYKREFVRSNRLGLMLVAFGFVWYFDLNFFGQFEGTFFSMLHVLMILIGILFIILLFYIFPVYVHYEMKIFGYIKYAVAFGFLHPGNLILMFVTGLCTYYFFIYFQAMIPLFGFSLLAQLNMWLAYQSFKRIAGARAESGA